MGGAPSLILPNLWLGGQDVLNDARFFETRNIGYVLSLGPAAPPPRIQLAGREHINIPDMPTADLSRHLARAVRFIAEGRHANNRCVYVHCAAGISRSTTCVCAYLMSHLGLSFHEALTFISSRRRAVCPNEGFTRQLKRFEASKERADLAEELARSGGSNYSDLRSRDIEELSRLPGGPENVGNVGPNVRPASRGGEVGRVGPNVRPSSRGGIGGPGNASRSAPPPRDRRVSGPPGRPVSRETAMTSVEQQAQQNALQAVRGAMSQYARENAARRPGGQENIEGLRIGNGDAKGDVGLSWLLRPLAENGGAPPAGRPSANGRGLPQPYPPQGGRRISNSQPAGRRTPAGRR